MCEKGRDGLTDDMTQTTGENSEVRYKIGDVCRIADVQPYVLRYWESEFPLLAADRSVPGPRTYSARELELIGQIKRLLYDEGYTIAGAKKRLESEAAGARALDASPDLPADAGKVEPPSEKTVKPPERPLARRSTSRVSAPVFVETSPASGQTVPVATAPVPAPRMARVVAELKEILEILSRD